MTQVRPMRADALRNRGRLLEVAAVAFAERGEGASLDDIARRAGVGVGTLYRHFPTRQTLLEAVHLGRVEAIAARADVLAGTLEPGPALVAWLDELAVGMLRARGLKALLGGAACCACVRSAAARLVRAAQDAGALRPDVEPVEVLRLVHGVVTAGESAAGDAGTESEAPVDGAAAVRRYLALVLEGLARG